MKLDWTTQVINMVFCPKMLHSAVLYAGTFRWILITHYNSTSSSYTAVLL